MRHTLVLGCAIAALAFAAGCASPSGEAADTSTGAATASTNAPDWVGLYGVESTQFIMALQVKSAEPFVFAISASRQNFTGITVDAANLTATYDDASKRSVTFHRGDCTLKLAKTELGIAVTEQGKCTSIGVPADMTQIDGRDLSREDDLCWDSGEKSFKVPGTCQSSAGFEYAAPAPKSWKGLYGTESTQFIMGLNVSSEEPLVFALSASRQNFTGITVDAHDLQATYDDAARTSATFTRGDCTLKLTKSDDGIAIAQLGKCTSIGVPADMVQLDGATLPAEDDLCGDSADKTFKMPGNCTPSAGF